MTESILFYYHFSFLLSSMLESIVIWKPNKLFQIRIWFILMMNLMFMRACRDAERESEREKQKNK